jgi:hypothetical protein
MLTQSRMSSLVNFLAACLLAGFLSACGGGGTNDGCLNIDPSRASSLPNCGTSSTPGNGSTSSGSVTLAMTDSAGAAFSALTPTQGAKVSATVKNSQNQPLANAVVAFTSTDSSAVFSPATGTALTDSSGVASVQLAAGTKAGAFTLTAASTIGGTSVKGSTSYTVSFPALSFSDMTINPTSLAAGGNASVSISVLSGTAAYTQPVSVNFTSTCVAAGKATIGTPVLTQNGVAVASYTDKGCGTDDTITATATVPNATLSKTGVITVLPASAGSIKFVGVDSSNIALKGTGGAGRPEYATVKFQVFDMNGSPLAGRQVSFLFADSNTTTTVGGLSLSPANGTTAADGSVSTVVANGTIPTSTRVVAKVVNSNPTLTTVSSVLVVSSGVPDQAHFSLSTSIGNCEGWNYDQLCSTLKVTAGDHFGNPVPDGTAINFSAEGGTVGASCLTSGGICTVPLYSASPRPGNGRVTVLAYALGEETLVDANGNNVFDAGDTFIDKSPDIFRDDNESLTWNAGEPCIGPNTSGTCSTPGDNTYNGVLRSPQLPSAQTLYVASQLVQTFSTSQADIQFPNGAPTCVAGTPVDLTVSIKDLNGNVMPFNTAITFSAQIGTAGVTVTPSSRIVANYPLQIGQVVPGATLYVVTISCPNPTAAGKFFVKVVSPNGVETDASISIN